MYTGGNLPTFFFAYLTIIGRVEFKTGRFLKLSLFKHNCVWLNSRWGEIVCKCRRAKMMSQWGKNNPDYAVLGWSWFSRPQMLLKLRFCDVWQQTTKTLSIRTTNVRLTTNSWTTHTPTGLNKAVVKGPHQVREIERDREYYSIIMKQDVFFGLNLIFLTNYFYFIEFCYIAYIWNKQEEFMVRIWVIFFIHIVRFLSRKLFILVVFV